MRELGVGWFRFDVPWRELAPLRPGGDRYDRNAASSADWGGYRWEPLDRIIDCLAEASISPLPVVSNTPDWAMGEDAFDPAAPPSRPEFFEDLARALVARYRGKVSHWELWNEPDHPHSWSGSLAEYVRLVLEPGAHSVWGGGPECRVLLGGLADHRNLESLHRAGGASLYDVASVHHYPSKACVRHVRRAVNHVRSVARDGGRSGSDPRPVWLTECGIATRPPSSPSGFGGTTDESGQASFVQSLYTTVPADAIFLYQLRDTAIVDCHGRTLKEVYWGLVSSDSRRRKAAFAAYQEAVTPVRAFRSG
jgi:hypothetical protein